ncbi:MAG: VOC family protein [Bulleidia sp.]|nr:VOC family protein [Bulleidia sp.]
MEIINNADMQDPEKTLKRTGFIHLAFSVGSKEKVDALTAQLKQDGYEVTSGPRTTGGRLL